MKRKSPFWLIALLLLGLAALGPLWARAQSGGRAKPPAKSTAKPATSSSAPATPQTVPLPADLEVKRLYLKDGNWQGVSKLEMKGNRVRYLSSERFEWEEIPASLVDWAATEKYAREAKAGESSPGSKEVDAEEAAERKKEQELTPQVAPGTRLPFQGGVFLLDVYNREAQLVELEQNLGDVNRNTGKNMLRAAINPIASQKQTIELKGAHARVQSHVGDPFIFVNVDPDQDPTDKAKPTPAKDRFRILRLDLDAKKNLRVVGNIKVAIWGKVSSEQKLVAANIEQFSGPWVKITPVEPLAPGEYALVEVFGDNQINRYVWDFGVDPKAPMNPGAWRPANTTKAEDSNEMPQLKKK